MTIYEKDACWGSGVLVSHLRSKDCTDRPHLCRACGAEAVTAGWGEYEKFRDMVFLCRACHPAHDRGTYQATPCPGWTVLLTYCTTTGSVIPRVVADAEVGEWTGYLWRRPAR